MSPTSTAVLDHAQHVATSAQDIQVHAVGGVHYDPNVSFLADDLKVDYQDPGVTFDSISDGAQNMARKGAFILVLWWLFSLVFQNVSPRARMGGMGGMFGAGQQGGGAVRVVCLVLACGFLMDIKKVPSIVNLLLSWIIDAYNALVGAVGDASSSSGY